MPIVSTENWIKWLCYLATKKMKEKTVCLLRTYEGKYKAQKRTIQMHTDSGIELEYRNI